MINEKELLDNLKQIHISMCCCFRDACKEESTVVKDPVHYPDKANKSDRYLRMCEDFEEFVGKYFRVYYNPRTNEWEDKK